VRLAAARGSPPGSLCAAHPHEKLPPSWPSILLLEKQKPCYDPLVMSDVRKIPTKMEVFDFRAAGQKNFCPGGRDNPLKRLVSDKEIKGNPSFFPWKNLAQAWAGLARL
jgi:hypothetical protein